MVPSPRPIFLALCVLSCTGVRTSYAQEKATTRNYEDDLNDILKLVEQKLFPIVSEIFDSGNVTSSCSTSLLKTFLALRRQEPWALRMILSTAIVSPNLFEGSFAAMGGYEQCLHTRARQSGGKVNFKGQYCSVYLDPPRETFGNLIHKFNAVGELKGKLNPMTATTDERYQHMGFVGAVCAPSLCTTDDLSYIARSLVGVYGANATVVSCRTDDPKEVTGLQAFSMAVLAFLLTVVAFATIVEWLLEKGSPTVKHRGPKLDMLLFFSALRNTRFLLKTDVKAERKSLMFIAGLKVTMACWVTLCHAYLLMNPLYFNSAFSIASFAKEPTFQFIINGFMSVSTFFFMSGFILAYSNTATRDTIMKRNPVMVYVVLVTRRYMRLTFPMMVVMLAAFLLPLLGGGPADEVTYAFMARECISSWWRVLVHSNNFISNRDMCLPHFWYVSTDLQIFIFIALPLGLLMLRFPKATFGAAVTMILGFSVLTTVQTYNWDLYYGFPFGANDFRKMFHTLIFIYFRPFTHVGSYICGILSGYLAFRYKNATIRPVVQAILWLASLVLASSIMFMPYPWNQDFLPDKVTNAIFGGFHRVFWAVSLFWPMYACATGRGGPLNKFLSWSFFLPLSRLTYCIYLVHALLFWLLMMRYRTRINIDQYFQVTTTLGVFAMSTFFAYLVHLTVEAPVFHLEKLLFEKNTGSNGEKPPPSKQENGVKSVRAEPDVVKLRL